MMPEASSPDEISFRDGLHRIGLRCFPPDELEEFRAIVRLRDRRHRLRRGALRLAAIVGVCVGVAYAVLENGRVVDFFLAAAASAFLAFAYASSLLVAVLGESSASRWSWRIVLACLALGAAYAFQSDSRDAAALVIVSFFGVAIAGSMAGVTTMLTNGAYAAHRDAILRDARSGEVWVFGPPPTPTAPAPPASESSSSERVECLRWSELTYVRGKSDWLSVPRPIPIVHTCRPDTFVPEKRPLERELARSEDDDLTAVERPLREAERADVVRFRDTFLDRSARTAFGFGFCAMVVIRLPILWLRDERIGNFEPYSFLVGGILFAALMLRAFLGRRRIERDLEAGKVAFVRAETDGAVLVEFLPESGLVLAEMGRPADFRTRA